MATVYVGGEAVIAYTERRQPSPKLFWATSSSPAQKGATARSLAKGDDLASPPFAGVTSPSPPPLALLLWATTVTQVKAMGRG
ncbi:UNVERIFIED_CONTAM: hypothetical protein Sangu_1966500 [Sesamum angustifolium]|uniref:Uncharacterized protein n=1 Tax=Sesamum angustifolium TaxID=2727405 RepID=A0AAW2LZD6_9LAMI